MSDLGDRAETVTAGVVVIGDEILSGRTRDTNSGYIAEWLTAMGIDLREVRAVPDVEAMIVEAVGALRAHYTYVFTTGGIGPTHDDITADAIAKVFGVGIDHDRRAVALLTAHYGSAEHLNEARLRMARIPLGADLIENRISGAPGFRIGNVHVLAGVPSIMKAMLDQIAPSLRTGTPMLSRAVEAGMGEGLIGTPLAELQRRFPDVALGSYPTYKPGGGFSTEIVARSRDPARLAEAAAAVEAMLARLRAERAS